MAKAQQLFVSAIMFLGVAWAAPAVADLKATHSINSPAKIEQRIKPQANVCVEGEECATAAPVAAAAPAGGAAAAARSPEDILNTTCGGCHNTGAAGAPKVGDAAAWAPRIAKGIDTLYTHALQGFNMMPPKGTCADCSDDDIKGVVDLMVSKSK